MSAICGVRSSGLGPNMSFDTALLYLTTVANALVFADEPNPLREAVLMLDPSLLSRARKEISRPDGQGWGFVIGVLGLYDVQVALCEFHRWGQPEKGSTANRKHPGECYDQRLRRELLADVEADGDVPMPPPKVARRD